MSEALGWIPSIAKTPKPNRTKPQNKHTHKKAQTLVPVKGRESNWFLGDTMAPGLRMLRMGMETREKEAELPASRSKRGRSQWAENKQNKKSQGP